MAEGKLSVDDPVLQFFPDEAPGKPSANLRAMRVRDLLTMATGHHNEDIQGFPYNSDESVVKKFLSLPVRILSRRRRARPVLPGVAAI